MEERNENDKTNREWQEWIEQPKIGRTSAKGENIDMKTLLEAEDRREKWHDTSISAKKERKDKQIQSGRGTND